MIGSTDSRSSISGDGASTITAEAIAALVSGELVGDGKAAVSGVAPLDRAGAQHLSILSSGKYAPMMATTKAGVVLVDPEFRDAAGTPRARIIVKQPLEKLLSLLPRLYPQESLAPGVASTARIGKGADLGHGVSIGEYAIIGANAKLGEGVVIGPHSVVGDNVSIGDNARLWPGVTIYPGAAAGTPALTFEFIRDGTVIGRSAAQLPEPDEAGRIKYVASFPTEIFAPGEYGLRAVAAQGAASASSQTRFVLIP